uniref:Uncharacterized protein n=1 Tax=Anguilla anguilla TaxID=7936 RepID=A0A0E9S1D0_ANGAN
MSNHLGAINTFVISHTQIDFYWFIVAMLIGLSTLIFSRL